MLGNSNTTYGTVSKVLHWLIAFLVIGLIIAGVYMAGLEDDDPRHDRLVGIHAQIGLTVLLLSLFRIVWRFVSPNPELPAGLESWEKLLTKAVAAAFLVLLVVQPVLMIIGFDYYDAPLAYLGIVPIPAFLDKDMAMVEQIAEYHEIVGITIAALALLHVAGALKHRYIDKHKDVDVLKRMT
jgi:cytochrome b561